MFRILYSIISSCANLGVLLVSPFNSKLRNFRDKRSLAKPAPKGKRKYWIHCSSLGEYEMAIPLLENLFENHNEQNVLITFFSPSGYEHAIKSRYGRCMMYLPLDSPLAVSQFYDAYEPEKALFIRYDLWYNFLYQGLNRKVEFYLINGRFLPSHKVFGKGGRPYFDLLKQFQQIFVSDHQSENELRGRGFNNVEYSGDTRFDRVYINSKHAKSYDKIERFKGNNALLVLGSSWQEEEKVLSELLTLIDHEIKVIIAPHDVSVHRINDIELRFREYKVKLWSSKNITEEDDILVFDSIGLLSSVYRYADVALVGGGFKGALHNIIEPAVWGSYISFGPKIDKFPEAQIFVEEGLAETIVDVKTWCNRISELVGDDTFLEGKKRLAQDFVKNNLGATSKVLNAIS